MRKKKKFNPIRKKFNRDTYALVVDRNGVNFATLKAMHDKGLIHENDLLFTLEAVTDIAFETFKGGWFNCVQQRNPKSKWSAETGSRQAREFTKEAF